MSTLLELLKEKKANLAASQGNREKAIKPPMGASRFRILPSWRGAGQQFWHDFGQHFIKDSSGTIKAVYACPDKTYGRTCVVCEAIAQGTAGATDDATMNILKDAKSAARILVNALHLDGPTPTKVQILELAPSTFKMLMDISVEWEEAGQSLFDADNGKDILFSREGAGLKTKYSVQVAAKSNPLPAGAITSLHNLDEYVQQESTEGQLRALNSVRAVAGMLPAPSPVSALPTTTGTGATAAFATGAAIAADVYEAAPAPSPVAVAPRPVAAVASVSDVVPRPAPKAAVAAPAAVVAAVAADATGDDELDKLLAQLG